MRAFLCLVLFLIVGCANVRDMISDPDEKLAFDALVEREARLKAEIASAVELLAVSPEDDALQATIAEKTAELEALEAALAEVEVRAMRDRFGPIWGTLVGLPIVGPYMQLAGPLAATFLLPMLSKRGRKHYWQAVKNLTPWVPVNGQRGVAFGGALVDVARALGLAHSSEASKAAAATS